MKSTLLFLAGLGVGILIGWGGLIGSLYYALNPGGADGPTSFFIGTNSVDEEIALTIEESEIRNRKVWARVSNPSDFELKFVFGTVSLFDDEGRLTDQFDLQSAGVSLPKGETRELILYPFVLSESEFPEDTSPNRIEVYGRVQQD